MLLAGAGERGWEEFQDSIANNREALDVPLQKKLAPAWLGLEQKFGEFLADLKVRQAGAAVGHAGGSSGAEWVQDSPPKPDLPAHDKVLSLGALFRKATASKKKKRARRQVLLQVRRSSLAEEGEQLFLEQEADIIELFRKKVVELYIREVEHAKLRTTRLRRAYSLGARLL